MVCRSKKMNGVWKQFMRRKIQSRRKNWKEVGSKSTRFDVAGGTDALY